MAKSKRVKSSSGKPYSRVSYYDKRAQIKEQKVKSGDFKCKDCTNYVARIGYCRYYKHVIRGKIIACPKFRSRIKQMLLGFREW